MANDNLKIRLDQLLVDKGLVETASKARARIMAGDVIVNDKRADKAGLKYKSDVNIRLRGNTHPYVSRGGLKLEEALKLWPGPIKDAICLDVGASTGGFSEVLLNFGAKKIYAIDVGYGQLAEKLRVDPRIVNMERTHILKLASSDLLDKPNIAVIDLSFISLSKVLAKISELLTNEAYIYALVKPQFEVGPEHVEKGGIVKDEAKQQESVQKIMDLALKLGFSILGTAQSPILGAKGNKEFLLGLRRSC